MRGSYEVTAAGGGGEGGERHGRVSKQVSGDGITSPGTLGGARVLVPEPERLDPKGIWNRNCLN